MWHNQSLLKGRIFLIYIYTFTISAFCAYYAERFKDKYITIFFSALCILIPSLLGGLRGYYVGTDVRVYGYPNVVMALHSGSFIDFWLKYKIEPGYSLICYSIAHLFRNLNWNLFAYQLITISCVYIGAYKHRKLAPTYFTMLMFFFLMYNSTYNAIRQSLAASVIFMGLDTLEKKQYVKFILYVSVATTFHYSAVISLPFIMGIHLFTTSKKFMGNLALQTAFIFTLIIVLFFIRQIMVQVAGMVPFLQKYIGYITSSYDNPENITNRTYILFLAGQLLMCTLYRKNVKKLFSRYSNLYNFEYYEYQLLFILYFKTVVLFFWRVLLYSEYANIIILSILPWLVKEKRLRAIVMCCVVGAATFYWWRFHIFSGGHETWPYVSIL